MNTNQDVLEQLRVQYEILVQEVSSAKNLLKNLSATQLHISAPKHLSKILVKFNGRLIIIRTQEIDWIEAWGDYIRLHGKGKSHIVHHKIGDMEKKLNPQQFFRIGRSAIINVDSIQEMEPLKHGDYLITLHDHTVLNMSRHYRHSLSAMFDTSS
jgi:two-component system, LytTR family, response regulator